MLAMDYPSYKRSTRDDYWFGADFLIQDQPLFDNRIVADPQSGIWEVAISPYEDIESSVPSFSSTTDIQVAPRSSRKRAYDEDLEREDTPEADIQEQDLLQLVVHNDYGANEPKIVELDDQLSSMVQVSDAAQDVIQLSNPFEEVAQRRHKGLNRPMRSKDSDSYVKIQPMKHKARLDRDFEMALSSKSSTFLRHQQSHSTFTKNSHAPLPISVPNMPPNFGKKIPWQPVDEYMFQFFVHAICSGRTLLPRTNSWLLELAPMADSNMMMRHAIVAFAAGYALDYRPNEIIMNVANHHYKRASEMISEALATDHFQIGTEDAIIGALRIMWCDDIVQWELRRDSGQIPRWLDAIDQAKKILAQTDPGLRFYNNHSNVQCSSARVSHANMVALVHLVAHMTMPLDLLASEESMHPWLLEGTEQDSRRVYGSTGLCPKLLHVLGQITHLSARMKADETSSIIPIGAAIIQKNLVNFQQWSELGPGCTSPEELLQSCQLNAAGLVNTEKEVTQLGAEAWVQAARIYLQVRFYRLPRNHRKVEQPYRILRDIITRMPCTGRLFTSQSPFFPVFLAGIVATTAEDRQVVRRWFETVVGKASSRSSVPPIWTSLQATWEWLDHEFEDSSPDYVDSKPIGDRHDWWENLVEIWVSQHGILSIV